MISCTTRLLAAGPAAAFGLSLSLVAVSLATADPLPLSWQSIQSFGGKSDHAAVVDPLRDRLLVSGGASSEDDFWSLDLNTLLWTRLGGFGYRKEHAAVYDPERDAMMYYGGWSNANSVYYQNGYRVALATNQWTQLGPSGAMPPGQRTNYSLLLDSAHDRLLILGTDTIYSYDILDNTWSSLPCSGQYPASDPGFGALVDAARDRAICLTDYIRAVNLTGPPVYSIINPGGTPPPSLAGHAVMDSTRSRLLLFKDDMTVWALSLGGSPEWSLVFSTGTAPTPCTGYAIALDAERDRALLCGGWIDPVGPRFADTWSFDFSTDTWSLLVTPAASPSPRSDHTAVRASSLDAMLVFGGSVTASNQVLVTPLSMLSPSYLMTPAGTPPAGRTNPAGAYDAGHDRLIVFGGRSRVNNALLSDVWALTLGANPTWQDLSTPGGPAAREASLACYDPVRDRLLVFGGRNGWYSEGKTDVWALSLSGTPAWEQLVADGTLGTAFFQGGVAIYDSLRDRLVMTGLPSNASGLGAWSLNLTGTSAWTSLVPVGTNPGMVMFTAGAYDTHDDRIILHGGVQLTGASDFDGVLTTLSLAGSPTFTRMSLPNAPLPRAYGTMVYDPIRHRTVVYGGVESWGPQQYAATAGAWLLSADASTPALASVVSADVIDREARLTWLVSDAAYTTWQVERSLRQGAWEAIGEPVAEPGDRLSFRDANLPAGAHVGYRLVASENGAERRMGETWLTVSGDGSFALAHASFANGRALHWAATAPGKEEARLDVFDVSGRRLGGQRLAPSGAEQRGELRLTQSARAGVYFVRLTQGDHRVTRRLARLD